jgi:hypothetical protein
MSKELIGIVLAMFAGAIVVYIHHKIMIKRNFMKKYPQPSIIGPGAMSIFVIIILAALKDNPQEKHNDMLMYGFISLLLCSFALIWMWQKYLKEYVAFTIEEKFRQINDNQNADGQHSDNKYS